MRKIIIVVLALMLASLITASSAGAKVHRIPPRCHTALAPRLCAVHTHVRIANRLHRMMGAPRLHYHWSAEKRPAHRDAILDYWVHVHKRSVKRFHHWRRTIHSSNGNVVLGSQLAARYGWGSGTQWSCLYELWNNESGWDVHKSNYAGSGAYGIPQALPGSKMGSGWQDSATVQIEWGLDYIHGRYGTPCSADAFQKANGWY